MKLRINALAAGRAAAFVLATSLALGSLISSPALAAAPETEQDKILYYIGIVLSGQPPFSTLRPEEIDLVSQGLQDSLAGKAMELDPAQYNPKVQEFVQQRMEEQVEAEKKAGEAYLAKKRNEDGARVTDSGLIFIEKKAGTGSAPRTTDTVKVHYHGTLSDGTVFDSSVERGTPAEFPLNRVIPCWTEGVAMIKAGGKAQLICPAEIAYGDQGAPPTIRGGATLTFDVELLEILPAP
ncbi:MAG: FKBP-type peptidyl-prolyl cis-trans isomerase [Myxococcota bacterium]|nr:FKBP-type peptidyl-prolyl cis-trans isomerase [Myxococcota bacterium]